MIGQEELMERCKIENKYLDFLSQSQAESIDITVDNNNEVHFKIHDSEDQDDFTRLTIKNENHVKTYE